MTNLDDLRPAGMSFLVKTLVFVVVVMGVQQVVFELEGSLGRALLLGVGFVAILLAPFAAMQRVFDKVEVP